MQATVNSVQLAIAEGVQWLESKGEYIFVDNRTEQVYGVDTVASDALRQLLAGVSFEVMLKDLAQAYDVEPQRLDADMRELLQSLASKGLINLQGVA